MGIFRFQMESVFYFSYTSLDIPHFLGYFIAYKCQTLFLYLRVESH